MIVAFYSYKGGVGRSQLCANIAAYYCFKKGKKVLLWDWDFEAPGLHYFFGKKTDELTQKGTLEMLEDYTSMMRTRTNISEDDYTFLDKKNIISLQKGEPENKDIGQIGLIAGGDYNNNFTFRVNHFDWYEFYELLDGKVYIESVKKWAKGLGYDYILIDSRTGINDYSGICNLQLPDANVVVMAANQQNIQGCKRIVGQIIKAEYTTQGYREPYVLPILSRINVNHPNFGDWANEFTEVFYFTLKELKVNVNEDFIKEIFRDFYLDKTLLGDEARFSAGENVLFTSERQFIPRASFMAKFRNIANYLEDLKMNKRIDMNTQIDKETWLYYAEKAVEENNDKAAAYAYEKADELDKSIEYGGNAKAFLKKGDVFFNVNKFDKAIANYQKVIFFKKNNYEAFFKLGLTYDNKKEYDKAIAAYQKAIDIKPDFHEAFFNMGIAYDDKKEYGKAIAAYQKAIDIKPDFHE
ncbi:MAG: KGGVGR-motif variant AAA ATPase, partial [Chitinophagales bacterium]